MNPEPAPLSTPAQPPAASPLAAAIAVLEAQRSLLGDAVVDAALVPLRRELTASSGAAAAPAPQRLKQVSVLFVDVVGSTAIGQQLGPEEIHAVMDGALERFAAAVSAHHGRVLQYTGDGMLAAFGTETASEDDAEEAVRAGLAIIETARALAPQISVDHGVADFDVRAGIHSGRVLLGGGVDADGSIRGATVNVAARMEQTAPPGRLRISHDTWRLVRGLFDVSEQPPITVKGVEQPLRSYLVDRPRPRAFRVPSRGIEGVVTPMVGRDAELAVLRADLDAVIAGRGLRAVTVVGDAGIGKSRLLAEFQQSTDPVRRPCWLLLSRAHPRSAAFPFGLLRDLVAAQLSIGDSDAPAVARDKFVAGIGPLLDDADDTALHTLGHLIGLDFSASPHLHDRLHDERRVRDVGYATLARCLRRIAAAKDAPVVLVFDDLHWADDGSIDFVRHLIGHHRDAPLLLLVLARPTLFERLPDWCASDLLHRRIDLAALDAAASGELIERLLQRVDAIPDALRRIVAGGAEGNPFYMEELVRMLVDDGVISAGADGWRVDADRLVDARVPSTLTGVLQARLDALPDAERAALQHASVVGHVFWDRALAAVDASAPDALPSLLRKQLVLRRDLSSTNDEYVFQHHLLHQVTYDSTLKEARLQAHRRVGDFWTGRAEVAGPHDVTPATCRALAEACEHRRQSDPAAFVRWFDAQFANYLHAYASQALAPLARSVVELCETRFGADHVETACALTNEARVALVRGEAGVAEPALRRALAIQERALGDDHPDTARTLAVLGGSHRGRGDYAAAEPCFRRALAIRERALGADHPLTLGTLENLAHMVNEIGRLEEAEALSRRVLAARERVAGADDPATANALIVLADVIARGGNAAAAEPLIRRAWRIQRQCLPAGHPDVGLTQWHLANVLHALQRDAEAEAPARDTLAQWETAFGPDHEGTAWALATLAEIRLARGDADESATLAARALAIHERNFGPHHAQVAAALVTLARALAAQGRVASAAPLLARAVGIQRSLGDAAAAALGATAAFLDTLAEPAPADR